MLSKEIRINEYNSRLVYFDDRNMEERKDEIDDEILRRRLKTTNDFSTLFNKVINKNSEILPFNCRYNYQVSKTSNIIITEDQPKIRTLLFDYSFERIIEKLSNTGKLEEYGYKDFLQKNKIPYKLRISLPYVVYIFNIVDQIINSVQVFFRLSPLNSTYDYLLRPNLCNISSSYYVCIGNNRIKKHLNLSDKINEYINLFWSTPFNTDYNDHCNEYRKISEVSDFLTWSYHTKQNPMFIFNVPWMKAGNLQIQIDQNIKNLREHNNSDNLYYKILSLFEDDRAEYRGVDQIFKNTGDSKYFNNTLVSVGDMFKFKNGANVYIKEFSYNSRTDKEYVEIEFENEKSSLYKMTTKFRNFILNQISESENILESTSKSDGEVVKVGDILCLKNGSLKKIEKIRRALDDNIEIFAGENYYLAKNLEASIFDSSSIEFNGVKITQGETYSVYSKEYNLTGFLERGLIFNRCISNHSKIYLKFEKEGSIVSYSLLDQKYYNIVKEEDLEKLPVIYRINSDLLKVDGYKDKEGVLIYNDDNTIIKNDIIENCLVENSLIIKGKDLDINFTIGDKVVVVDWETPINMLKIKTITNYIVDDFYLFIEVTDSSDNKELIPYINITNKTVMIGDIRKISTGYDNIRSGMKIKANVKGIPNFPKKDTNIIIGFITDTGEDKPLVLCSNCCTLWIEDLINNFTIIPKSSKSWSKLNHVPIEIEKIKPQIGDLFVYNNNSVIKDINIIHCDYYNKLFFTKLNDIVRQNSTYIQYDQYQVSDFRKFSGILNPRKKRSLQQDRIICKGVSNLHNVIKPIDDKICTNRPYLKFDIRRIEDV